MELLKKAEPRIESESDSPQLGKIPKKIERESESRLVGISILAMEQKEAGFSKKELESASSFYSKFVDNAVKSLKTQGLMGPGTEHKILDAALLVTKSLRKEFYMDESIDSLIYGINSRKLDCDTSAFFVADALSRIGVESRIIVLSNHAVLGVDTPKGRRIYIETTSEPPDLSYFESLEKLEEKHGKAVMEFPFQSENLRLNAHVHASLSSFKLMKGDIQGSIEQANKAIKEYPGYSKAYQALGNAKLVSKDFEGAKKALEKAIELTPADSQPYVNLGVVLIKTGNKNGAIINFKKALELNPNDVTALTNSAFVSMVDGDPAGALGYLDRAVSLSPKSAHLHMRRALANEALGKTEEAKADLEKANSLGNTKIRTVNGVDLLFP